MTALIVFAAIALIIFFVMILRVGLIAEYSNQGLKMWLQIGPFCGKVYPQKKKKVSSKQKKTGEKAGKGLVKQLLEILSPILKTLGKLRRKLRIDLIEMSYTVAGKDDPAAAAVRYGMISAGGGVLIPLVDTNFTVKKWDTNINVDFTAQHSTVYAKAHASYRVGQLVSIALSFLCSVVMTRSNNESKQTNR